MAFPRGPTGSRCKSNAARSPEIGDLAGATFIVNGRAFSGTGVGYNPLAPHGRPAAQRGRGHAVWNGGHTVWRGNRAHAELGLLLRQRSRSEQHANELNGAQYRYDPTTNPPTYEPLNPKVRTGIDAGS